MSNNITSQPGANNGMDYQKSNNGYVNAARRSWTGPNILAESTCGCFGKQWSMQWGCCGGKSKAGMKGYGLFD
nr:uncharacterized protein CI109_000043 [Kwoniella shandongensis]KAA5531205.1 hypothetical protein CI109_000043 [Kwoniella shandongensis]